MNDIYTHHQVDGYAISVSRCADGLEAEIDGGNFSYRMKMLGDPPLPVMSQTNWSAASLESATAFRMVEAMTQALYERQCEAN